MKKNYSFAILMLLICLIKTAPASAQHSNSLQGYWMGNLKINSGEEIRMAFRIQQHADKGYSANMDVPDQGAMGIPATEVEVIGENVLIDVKAIGAVYEGIFNSEKQRINGSIIQGDTTSLTLVAVDLNSPEGVWMGPLEISGGEVVRALFDISEEGEGAYSAEFGVPDQGAMGIPVEKIEFVQNGLNIDLKKYGISFHGTMLENGLAISGSFIQGDTVELVLARYGSMPDLTTEKEVVVRPQTPEAPYPYLVEDVVFENYSANVKLAGTLTMPQSEIPSPAVILIHGSGRNDRNGTFAGTFHLLADYLTRRGIAVLRYDKRGAGESTGDYGRATTLDFTSDVKAGIEFLKKNPRIDQEAIGLIGHSEGGVIAPMVASERDDVAFMVIMAGLGQTFGEAASYMRTDYARSIGKTENEAAVIHSWYSQFYELAGAEDDTVQRQIKIHEAYNTLPYADKEVIGWSEDDISREVKGTYWIWFHEALKLEPAKYFKETACPTLALTGEKDKQANPMENLPIIEQSLKNGKCSDYRVVELPGLNHLFQTAETGAVSEYEKIPEIIAPMALQTISEWIEERVNL